ncbi:MAG: hypothetical protein IJR00_02310 [Lachnospiraceae bacterium]|nr:hypothetical protein [Lachnospiraceae bacterium]
MEKRIRLPSGEYAEIVAGTPITHVEVIAGRGRIRQIDEADILVDLYGGTALLWQKKKGIASICFRGEIYKAEIHWYEEPTVGRVKYKVKSYNGEWIIHE